MHTKIVVICYYRPSSCTNITPLCTYMDKIIQLYTRAKIILVGDFNMPNINWNHVEVLSHMRSFEKSFLGLLAEQNLDQKIQTPTHIKGNILDLFCTNIKERCNENVIEPGLSDHFLVSVSLPNVKSMNSSVPQKEVRLYHKTNLNGFQKGMHELHQLVVNEINEGLDINTVWNTFRDGMWQNVNKFVPVQQRRVKSPHEPPWFNISARKACNKQHAF